MTEPSTWFTVVTVDWQVSAPLVATQHEVLPVVPHAVSAQSRAHCPQFVTLVMSVSQPSHGSLSQLSHPVAQAATQTPLALHVFVVTCAAAAVWQARPQAPQCALLLARFSSQPSHGSMSQLSRSVPQTGLHMPPEHVLVVVPVGV